MTGETLRVLVDSREAPAARAIMRHLRTLGCEVEVSNLQVCDYLVSERCAVERKEVRDFVKSIVDGRLFRQAAELKDTYEAPIIVVQGYLPAALRFTRMSPMSVWGAMTSLALDFRIPVINTPNSLSTAQLIQRLAHHEQARKRRPVQPRPFKKTETLADRQVYLLCGLPRVGASLAEELLKSLGTPMRVFEEICRAEVSTSRTGKTKTLRGPLSMVRGVGPTIVEEARKVLTTPYRVNNV